MRQGGSDRSEADLERIAGRLSDEQKAFRDVIREADAKLELVAGARATPAAAIVKADDALMHSAVAAALAEKVGVDTVALRSKVEGLEKQLLAATGKESAAPEEAVPPSKPIPSAAVPPAVPAAAASPPPTPKRGSLEEDEAPSSPAAGGPPPAPGSAGGRRKLGPSKATIAE